MEALLVLLVDGEVIGQLRTRYIPAPGDIIEVSYNEAISNKVKVVSREWKKQVADAQIIDVVCERVKAPLKRSKK